MTLQEIVDKAKAILASKEVLESNKRLLLVYYILLHKGIYVMEVLAAKINDKQQFENNYQIAKMFFKSFKD